MKKEILKVLSNEKLTETIFEMRLSGSSPMLPGQFVELLIPGFSLRRPFSVAEYDKGILTIIYKVMGRGTEEMSTIKKNTKIDTLTGLGRGFSLSGSEHPLLIGGGIGIAPLIYLARVLYEREKSVKILLCGRCNNDLIKQEEIGKYGEVFFATDDGSCGFKGNALEAAQSLFKQTDHYYACGPMPMLKALATNNKKGELSLEAHMGCGFGACMGCSIQTTDGPKRVCKEGPVFQAGEVIF
ncbi:MAG: dihydroorotate dehydrogenase electron transfer subunit [Clostridiales bacterium]|nr:dihydroorotate dehydrogenase electron transfer subunit [Clostridiales bacterium]